MKILIPDLSHPVGDSPIRVMGMPKKNQKKTKRKPKEKPKKNRKIMRKTKSKLK